MRGDWRLIAPNSTERSICSRCVLDTSVPDIRFDMNGQCNYCVAHDRLDALYPTDSRGQTVLRESVARLKASGANRRYDCVVGLSGGTDSTYLLYWAKQVGLRPLAVHFDNGWNSAVAVRNIELATKKLDVDLFTYVVDWQEFRELQVAFLRASTPDAEGPSDMALRAALYRVAAREDISAILVGVSFRTEGKVPIRWSYIDGRYITSVAKQYGLKKFHTYPNFTIADYLYFGLFKRITQIRPLWYMPYSKRDARALLTRELGWTYYGGHHFESIYTRFNQGVYLRRKFGIDKRRVEFSAQVRSAEMKREDALTALAQEPYPIEQQQEDCEYVRKKLRLSDAEFDAIMSAPRRSFSEYKTYFDLLKRHRWAAAAFFKMVYKSPPQIFQYLD